MNFIHSSESLSGWKRHKQSTAKKHLKLIYGKTKQKQQQQRTWTEEDDSV